MLVEIDLVKLVRNELNINEYLTIVKAYNNLNGKEDIPFLSDENSIKSLLRNEWLTEREGGYDLTKRAIMLVGDEAVDFDELFSMYPHKTPDGRILRCGNKEFRGRMTADYKKLRDKYLRKVRNTEIHAIVIEGTKALLSDYKKRGSLNYLPLMETFINQNQWERYVTEEPVTGKTSFGGRDNIERL